MSERSGTRVARRVQGQIRRIVAALGLIASKLRLQFGAGEGNRTPTVSLGS